MASTDGDAGLSRRLDRAQLERVWVPRMLGVLRIMTGLLFLPHGTHKILGWPESLMFKQPPVGSLIWVAGILEIVGGPLIILGLLTRPVAFVLSGFMAVAYFIQLAPRNPFPMNNTGDAAILFCFVFLYLVAAGPGAFSVDGWLRRRVPQS